MNNSKLEFEQVYAEFQPKVYRYLVRLIGVKEAEDLAQDVFVKVAKALGTFDDPAHLSTWIYHIATNASIDKMRSRSSKQLAAEIHSLTDADLNDKNVRSGKRQRSVEEQIMRKQMNECIQANIAILPEGYRLVLTLSELEGFKNSEIAVILGLSLGTVKIRLHRAKQKLKGLLLANCNFYRTECCGRLVCEPKGFATKNIKRLAAKNTD